MRKITSLLLCLMISIAGGESFAATSHSFAAPDKLTYPELRFKPPQAERLTLSNGMILYILEDHELPLVNVNLLIKTGSYFDPEGKEGLAELTGSVMRTGGTETMTGRVIDEALESLAVNIDVSVQTEYSSINFSSLKNTLDEGFQLLARILMQPVFAQDKLSLARDLKLEELRRIADDPQQYAFREFNKLLYQGNPRGRLPSPRSVGNIVRDDLLLFHSTYFNPDNMMIAITGDVAKNEVLSLFAKHFDTWQKRGKAEKITTPAPIQNGGIYFLPKDVPQSVIITGRLAPAKKSQDYYAFTILDFVLGSGGFRSRIFQEIRSDQGLAYSAGSFYRARSDYGVFGTYGMTKAASTGKVLSLLWAITEKTRNNPADSQELNWAKSSLNNSFIFSFTSTEQIARQQLLLDFDKMPLDFLVTYQARIKKVSKEDLKRVALKYLSATAITLVAGKESDFDLPLSTFGNIYKLSGN